MALIILGTGSDLPQRVVTNDEIEAASSDFNRARAGESLHDWSMARSGVATRHRVEPGEGTTEMAIRAAERALSDSGLTIDDIDLIVLGTLTSDSRLPSTVSTVARALGARAKCIQLETACTGFLDSMMVATSLLTAGPFRTAVVIAVDALSALIDPQKFLCQTVFGDGAAAVVVRDVPGTGYGIEAVRSHTDPTHCDWTWAPGGGTKHPITAEVLEDRSHYLSLDYRSIYGFAVEKMVDATYEILTAIDLTVDDVDWLILHQTGANIIRDTAEQLKIPPERVITCLDHTGNVSGASVGIALDEAHRQGRLSDGDRIAISVVGAGMSWGAMSMVWREPRPRGVGDVRPVL